MNRTLSDN